MLGDRNETSEPQSKSPLHSEELSSPILKENLDAFDDEPKINASFKEAESRLFPVGHPNLIASPPLPLSPFDVTSFSNSLIPLVSATIKEKLQNLAPAIRGKVNDVAQVFNDGFDLVEDTIREGWRESPLNPYNFDRYLNRPPNLFKHIPALGGQPASHHHHPKFSQHQKKLKEKAPTSSTSESYSVDNMMYDYGINGYKHFEETILKELERQEEAKVEATIHTLFNEGDHVEIIRGKPHYTKSGWSVVAAPTKTYEDSNDITSQIVSPLHTSIFSLSELPSESSLDKLPSGFHDFDSFHPSSYAVNEEGIESKVKPVKTRIAAIKRITPVPFVHASRSSSTTTTTVKPTVGRSRITYATTHHKKRHNSLKTNDDEKKLKPKEADSSVSESNDIPAVVAKVKQVNIHVQSLTTSKPKNHANIDRNSTLDTVKAHNYEAASRFRLQTTTSSLASKSTFRVPKITSTTSRPRTVQREASKFVDKARATGYRGSVKYGQSTIKEEDQN